LCLSLRSKGAASGRPMVTEYFIPDTSFVLIIRLKERLVLNYFVNFLDGGAYIAAFPGAPKPLFNLGIGNMIGSSFKDEWCPFSRNRSAGSPTQMVSAELGLTPTQQTSCTSIIATGFTTLVITRKLGSTMAILINMSEITSSWMATLQEILTSHIFGLEFPCVHNVSAHFIPHVIYLPSREGIRQTTQFKG